ncbi:glucose-1-phosphate adenylyltransferase family protein [Desulfurivibrio alkaliphilus]|uniref:Nucleotidyl transferase n=1 Tax=Desulfurivibrio alkaliphilus (strain DSM 19089 / UNIQEM U267 / AHT2) TaxID=589865 RepID=D6Z3D8_DESAT|nr:glucose-1-phosphate adenylyltransferase family protein [Desulfurivibrio alkaliphilus]ADH86063.1 Nucleotidyl transferase [Desulfurivibrio alkaliphilus AHT 2]
MRRLKPEVMAVILAGGRVDELSVLTAHRPKSAVPFGGFARVIDFALSNLMQSGLELVAVLSQYRSFSLINHLGIGASWDMVGRYRGVYVLPPYQGFGQSSWYRGSADAVRQNLDFIQFHEPETVLVISGDHIYHQDYRKIIEYHRQKDADCTMACVEVPRDKAHRFGVAEIDDEDGETGGRVLQYREKPEKPEFTWASMTVYCFKPKVLYELLEANAREDESFEFGRDILPRAMIAHKKIYGYKFHGYWGYTRTVEEYWQTSMDLLGPSPRLPMDQWGLRTNLDHRGIRDYQPLKVGAKAVVSNSLIYNGCVVEGTVENSILFPGVQVKAGAVVRDSVLFFDNVVGRRAQLDKVVSDVNVTVGDEVQIGSGASDLEAGVTVLGWNNQIPAGMLIGAGCTLYPALGPEKMARNRIADGEVVR